MDIKKMLADLNTERARIDRAIAALEQLDGQAASAPAQRVPRKAAAQKSPAKSAQRSTTPARRKRRLSPEGRKRISEMMKQRWAERRKKQGKAA